MVDRLFELNDVTFSVMEELGRHMPGGFFIYQAKQPEQLIYANPFVFEMFGCKDAEEFRELTGYTFRGMVHPDDYARISSSIDEQIATSENNQDYVEYRIIRRDGSVRWVDDYGHYAESKQYGGVYYVFISDITEKRTRNENVLAVRQAVIEALSEAYHTVWLINDVDTESFSLYRGDTAGDTIHASPILEALKNMKYSQAKEYYIQTMVAQKDQKRLQKELDLKEMVRRLQEKPQFNINYLRKMEDGSERYFRIEFAKLNMPNGAMGIVCGFKDVDEDVREGQKVQKALRDAKRKEEENLKLIEQVETAAKLASLMGSVASLLSNMPAMSFSKEADTGKYLACNQAFAEYAHKASPEGVIGLTDFDIFDEATAQHFVEDDAKALSMDEPYVFFEDVPDARGNMRSLQTTKLKFTDTSGKLCTLGMCVDVTTMTEAKARETEIRVKQQELEHRLALQEELIKKEQEHAEQTQLITALASDYWAVYYIDLDKDEGVCYQAHSEIKGLKQNEHFAYRYLVEDYAKRYVTEPYYEEFMAFVQPESIKEKLMTQRVISYRYMVKRNGRETYEMVKFAGVRHPEDREDHLVHKVGACFTDVDGETRRNLEHADALNNALASARDANKAKTAFLSNMSHEIRTPMNAIIGLNNIALNDPEVPPKTREYLEKNGNSAQHLLNIINDILDMSRIESGKMVLKQEEFAFHKALEQVNAMISSQCREKGLHYECRTIGTIDDYYIGDEMKLRQIMINILGNAVKFTPSGGNVSFVIEELNRFDKKATLRMTFADNGIGMSKDYLPHLFDSFSQEDTSSTNKYGSTGLGMPITKNIVEMMNGTIDVQSEKGEGSIFTVTLTLGESDRKKQESKAENFHPSNLHVLVIDDDPIALEHAKIVLGQVGIDCEVAMSGEKGVEMVKMHHARRKAYDLILVDWKMPGMDGVETTKAIREIAGHESAIIILTSYHWDDVEEEARKAGVDSFVAKPLFASNVIEEFRVAFEAKESAMKERKADLRGRHILLAEDVPINAEIMIMILSAKGMQVDLAENGRIAVEKFENCAEGYYDAVLMDMRMPEMDGLEATRRIREMEREDARSIPMIALTANAFDEDVQRSMQAGLNAHLSKPIDANLLYETLESLIR